MSRWIILAVALLVLIGTDDEHPAAKDQSRLEGVWRFALVEVEGVKAADAPLETNKLIVSKDGRYVIVQGPRITRGVIKLGPTKTPKQYDVSITNGPTNGLTVLGVYELDGDVLEVCLPFRGKERPTSLIRKPGSGCLFFGFQREQVDVKSALITVARQELAGEWQAVSYALNGNKASDDEMKKIQLVMDAGGKFRAVSDAKVFIAGATTIDPTQGPMSIDLTYTEGGLKGTNSLGIYQIEGDLLTICRAAPGKGRPTEFSSQPGSGQALMTYKRGPTPGTSR